MSEAKKIVIKHTPFVVHLSTPPGSTPILFPSFPTWSYHEEDWAEDEDEEEMLDAEI
jgi:hypothetical protein